MATITDKGMQAKPADRDVWLVESGARGEGRLVGRITPAGARAFYYRYTGSNGAQVRMPIGPFDSRGDGRSAYTVQQARDRARDLAALYRAGIKDLREHFAQQEADRQAAADAERQAAALEAARRLTVRQLFDRWCSTELQPMTRADGRRTGRKDGGAYVRAQFERHVFPVLGDILAADLRKADLLAVIDAQKAKGQLRTAAVLLSDLRQMMAFALDRELIESDPLASVKKARIVGAAVERDRVLSVAEVRALAAALPSARMSQRSEAAVWLLLATGARVGELMGAVWADTLPSAARPRGQRLEELQALAEEDGVKVGVVNLAAATWHLPDTKNQRPHTIHLSAFALQHFRRLLAVRETLPDSDDLSSWVFPARNTERPVCVKSFGKQLSDRQRDPERRMSGRSSRTTSLSLPGGRWTAHDLRRTAGTLMASLGISGDVIDECLNHMIESRVRRTYIRDRREAEQVQAFDALGLHLQQLIGSGK
ncbi:tyrosine-type recombinase/integrase [Ideonella dechloratans]|uniref:tyrosine-type recombinase/integrase n=1 Tax=Ideonella dechloratans TaxID=36863 RepID=UPI0035AEA5B2